MNITEAKLTYDKKVKICIKCKKLFLERNPHIAHLVPSCIDKRRAYDDLWVPLCQKCHAKLENKQILGVMVGASLYDILRVSINWLNLSLLRGEINEQKF